MDDNKIYLFFIRRFQVHQWEQKEKNISGFNYLQEMWGKILYSCELYAVSMELFSDGRTFIENKSLFLCGQKNLTSTYLRGWQEILGIGTLSVEADITIANLNFILIMSYGVHCFQEESRYSVQFIYIQESAWLRGGGGVQTKVKMNQFWFSF